MPQGFYLIIASQFISALADNALLLVAMARMQEMGLAVWLAPLLKLTFTVSYVVLAPWVGALADAVPEADEAPFFAQLGRYDTAVLTVVRRG